LISKNDYKKLTDYIYRKSGISIGEKRYDILKPKLETYMTKKGFLETIFIVFVLVLVTMPYKI